MAVTARLTKAKRALFLEALGDSGIVTQACARFGLARASVYRWRDQDESFAQAWAQALERGVDALEDEAVRRALEGRLEPVFYQGKECGAVRKYSDALLMFMLKARRPQTYKDRAALEHSGKDGVPLTPVINLTIGKNDPEPGGLDRPEAAPETGRSVSEPGN